MDMDKQSLKEIKKRYDEDGFVILKNYYIERESIRSSKSFDEGC